MKITYDPPEDIKNIASSYAIEESECGFKVFRVVSHEEILLYYDGTSDNEPDQFGRLYLASVKSKEKAESCIRSYWRVCRQHKK